MWHWQVPFSDFRLVRGPVVSWKQLLGARPHYHGEISRRSPGSLKGPTWHPPGTRWQHCDTFGERPNRAAQALAGAPALSNLSAVYQIGFTVPWLWGIEGRSMVGAGW